MERSKTAVAFYRVPLSLLVCYNICSAQGAVLRKELVKVG